MAAAGAHAASLQITATNMRDAIVDIVNSQYYDPQAILENKLTLSQAYCLLWQNAESGDVFGRQCSNELIGGAAAAVVLDLIVMGKVEVVVTAKSTLGIEHKSIKLKVVQDSPTGTYLDNALMNKILKHYGKNPDHPKDLKDWLYNDISQLLPKNKCATKTLDSLVDIGILDKKEKALSINYPTLNPGPEESLVKEIRRVALDDAEPDSFIRAVLTVMRAVDNLHVAWDPLLKRHFDKDQYSCAKARIKALVGVNKKGKEKYEAV